MARRMQDHTGSPGTQLGQEAQAGTPARGDDTRGTTPLPHEKDHHMPAREMRAHLAQLFISRLRSRMLEFQRITGPDASLPIRAGRKASSFYSEAPRTPPGQSGTGRNSNRSVGHVSTVCLCSHPIFVGLFCKVRSIAMLSRGGTGIDHSWSQQVLSRCVHCTSTESPHRENQKLRRSCASVSSVPCSIVDRISSNRPDAAVSQFPCPCLSRLPP